MKIKRSLAFFIVILAAVQLSAQLVEDQAVQLSSARTAAIGGIHTALADDFTTLFSNPAGLRAADPEVLLADITLSVTGPVFSVADLLAAGGDITAVLSDPASPAAQLLANIYSKGVLNGPIGLGYVGNGFGIGFFNKSGVVYQNYGKLPVLTASVEEDVMLCGGFAFRIPLPEISRMTLDLGLLIKTFAVGKVEISDSILSLMNVSASLDFSSVTGNPFLLDIGAGLDLGIRWSWNKVFTVGIAGRNLPAYTMRNLYPSIAGFLAAASPVTSFGYIPVDLSAGIEFSPPLGFLGRFITNMKLLVDYEDILDFVTHPDTARNPILHAGVGIELALLEILFLRGGFFNGYFSAGLGLDLTIFTIDLAMYGSELSAEPGLWPSYNLVLGIQFSY